MKALQKVKKEKGMILTTISDPQIQAHEVLVEVMAAGVCGSDVHIYEWTGGYEWLNLPLICGHEFSGRIVQTGEAVEGLQIGQKVVCRVFLPCGECAMCRQGFMNKCLNSRKNGGALGISRNGGFAEYVAVPASYCVSVPEHLSFEEAALAEPLGIAANAVHDAKLMLGDVAVIFGPGGIGLLTLLCAKAVCSTVIMVGTAKDKKRLEMAKELGADLILYAGEDNVSDAIMGLTGGLGADVVFEATGYPPVVQQGLDVLRKCGRMVLIGIHPDKAQIDVTQMVRDAKTNVGAYGGPVTWERVIAWLASDNEYARRAGRIITGRIPLEDYEAAFERSINSETIKEMFVKI